MAGMENYEWKCTNHCILRAEGEHGEAPAGPWHWGFATGSCVEVEGSERPLGLFILSALS